jgi:hypothetical protein
VLSVPLNDLQAAKQYLDQRDALPIHTPGSVRYALSAGLRAHVLLAGGKDATALALLPEIPPAGGMEQVGFSPFYSRAFDRFTLAELHRKKGEDDHAMRWYRSLTEGCEVLFVAPAHFRMAQIYKRQNQPDSAAAHDSICQRRWRNADSSAKRLLADTTR